MKTIAEFIGEKNDPMIEDVRALFSKHSADIANQMCASPIEWRRLEWLAAKEIVDVVKQHLNTE